jgi:methionyl aminopeptidase
MIKLKTDDDIKKIRESGRILAETHYELKKMVSPGITTGELDRFAKSFIEKRGASPAFLGFMDYPASLCVSVNSEIIHGIPGKRKLKDGDIVSLDLGVDLKGYFSDMAFTMAVGTVPEATAQLIRETRTCLNRAIEQVRNGNRINDLGKAVWEHAKKFSYGVVKEYCGHGVGYSQHEEPQIPNYIRKMPNPRLKNGMVIAIEPMINLGTGDVVLLDDGWTVETADGSLSAHWEHTIAVSGNGFEVLTAFPDIEL